jgi:hypothetical protein
MRVCQFRHFGTERFGAAPRGKRISSVRARQTGSGVILSHSSPCRERRSPCWTRCNSRCYKGIHSLEPAGRWRAHGILSVKEFFPMTAGAQPRPIPDEQAKEIRRLSHDLSNALEVVLQTSFLLGTVPMDEDAKKWRQMLDSGVQQAAEINRKLREYVRDNS